MQLLQYNAQLWIQNENDMASSHLSNERSDAIRDSGPVYLQVNTWSKYRDKMLCSIFRWRFGLVIGEYEYNGKRTRNPVSCGIQNRDGFQEQSIVDYCHRSIGVSYSYGSRAQLEFGTLEMLSKKLCTGKSFILSTSYLQLHWPAEQKCVPRRHHDLQLYSCLELVDA